MTATIRARQRDSAEPAAKGKGQQRGRMSALTLDEKCSQMALILPGGQSAAPLQRDFTSVLNTPALHSPSLPLFPLPHPSAESEPWTRALGQHKPHVGSGGCNTSISDTHAAGDPCPAHPYKSGDCWPSVRPSSNMTQLLPNLSDPVRVGAFDLPNKKLTIPRRPGPLPVGVLLC